MPLSFAELPGKDTTEQGKRPRQTWPGEGALQRRSSTSSPWQGTGVWAEQEKPTNWPRKGLVRGPARPSPLSRSAGSPSSQCRSLQPGAPPQLSAVASLGIVVPTQRACSCRHRESRSCQRAAQPLLEPPSSAGAETEVLEPPFLPSLQVLPFPSRFSKRPRQERKARALGAVRMSANSTGAPAATPPNVLQVWRKERALTAGTSARLQAAPAAPERERLSV